MLSKLSQEQKRGIADEINLIFLLEQIHLKVRVDDIPKCLYLIRLPLFVKVQYRSWEELV